MPSLSLQIHLFDIDVPGKIRFQESETLSPGSALSVFETRECSLRFSVPESFSPLSFNSFLPLCLCPTSAYCTVGVGICYDIRFAELAQIYAQKGTLGLGTRLLINIH